MAKKKLTSIEKIIADANAAAAVAQKQADAAKEKAGLEGASREALALMAVKQQRADALKKTVDGYEEEFQFWATKLGRGDKLNPVEKKTFDRLVKNYKSANDTRTAAISDVTLAWIKAKNAQIAAGIKPAGALATAPTGAAVGPNYTKAPPAISGGAAKVVVKTPTLSKTPGKVPDKTPGVVIPGADEAHATAVAALQAMGQTAGGYAIQMGLIDSDPSLKELFYNDVYLPISQGKAPVSASKFQADLLNTKWYKGYIEPAREAEAIKYGDPATWEASVVSATKIVRDNALAMGYDISPEQVATTVDMFLHKAGGKAEQLTGLPLAELKTYISSIGKLNASGGLAASGIANLKGIAADYGVAHLFGTGDDWFKTQQDAILKGTTTQAAVEQAIKSAAKSSYGALSSQIDAGMSVKSILSPYANLMGNILEIAPGSADISDPKFASNVFIQDPADPSKQILKPLWQYQQDLKKDPRWAYTQNARADLDQVGHSVLTSLGLTY